MWFWNYEMGQSLLIHQLPADMLRWIMKEHHICWVMHNQHQFQLTRYEDDFKYYTWQEAKDENRFSNSDSNCSRETNNGFVSCSPPHTLYHGQFSWWRWDKSFLNCSIQDNRERGDKEGSNCIIIFSLQLFNQKQNQLLHWALYSIQSDIYPSTRCAFYRIQFIRHCKPSEYSKCGYKIRWRRKQVYLIFLYTGPYLTD